MIHRRTLLVACLLTTVASVSGFAVGVFHARHATAATTVTRDVSAPGLRVDAAARAALVAEVKQQLASEMGLLPVSVLRDRRSSFVELYSHDKEGKTHYGTAGYLGQGYFITVKHAVVALAEGDGAAPSPITSVRVMYNGEEIPAKVIDTGDANVEVHSGDWAIIKSREVDLPALRVDSAFAFEFADPIFRLGNDYSRGIILSTGYVGQRTSNGLVTCLIDGHPGVSGGGVLNREGDLVGIPIGRLEGDYRFSFLLPVRAEMFRKVPGLNRPLTS
jgi:S1-C subfamily serine protease